MSGVDLISKNYLAVEALHKKQAESRTRPKISVICWTNDINVHNQFFAPTFEKAKMWGYPEWDFVLILPQDRCRNIGEAYNLGRMRAKFPVRLYMHQDVMLSERWFAANLWAELDPALNNGVGAAGVLGSTIDTGGSYFFCHPKYQIGAQPDLTSNAITAETEGGYDLALLDGLLLATNQDIEWCEDYEGSHFAIEDMCMRIREQGLRIRSIESRWVHQGGQGRLDDGYWRSMYKFRERWAHMLPADLPPVGMFQAFTQQYRTAQGMVHYKLVQAGFYDIVWQAWRKQLQARRAKDKKAKRVVERAPRPVRIGEPVVVARATA